MEIDIRALEQRAAYRWMADTLFPRPIAWVSTLSPEGKPNLAPFSFFQGVTSNPPTLMFVPANDRHGQKKDTLRNIETTKEFVVNLVPYVLAETMNLTASLLPYGESEFESFSVDSAPARTVKPARVAKAPVSYECELHSIVRIGEGPAAGNVVFGSIKWMHVNDDALAQDGWPDALKLDLVGRLGGNLYTRTQDQFSMKRPDR